MFLVDLWLYVRQKYRPPYQERRYKMTAHEISSVVRKYTIGTLEVLLLIPTLPFLLAVLLIEYTKD